MGSHHFEAANDTYRKQVFPVLALCAGAVLFSVWGCASLPADRTEIRAAPHCALSEPFGGRKNVAVLDRSEDEIAVTYYYIDEETGTWTEKPISYGNFVPPLRQRYDSIPHRVYWSPEDDLVMWQMEFIWLAMSSHVDFASAPTFFFRRGVHIGLPWVREYDAIPEHVGWIARNIGMAAGRVPVEFDIRTQGMWWEPGSPGMGHTSPGTWTESGAYISLARYPAGGYREFPGPDARLEIWRPDAEEWQVLHPRILPPGTNLHLARENEGGDVEAVISYTTPEGREVLERVRGGGAAPIVIAEGPFSHIVSSPDRMRMFGTFDRDGRFRRAAGETFSAAEEFWLFHLERMGGVEKFYFLDDARSLLVKTTTDDEVRIEILDNTGGAIVPTYTICREARS